MCKDHCSRGRLDLLVHYPHCHPYLLPPKPLLYFQQFQIEFLSLFLSVSVSFVFILLFLQLFLQLYLLQLFILPFSLQFLLNQKELEHFFVLTLGAQDSKFQLVRQQMQHQMWSHQRLLRKLDLASPWFEFMGSCMISHFQSMGMEYNKEPQLLQALELKRFQLAPSSCTCSGSYPEYCQVI